MHFIMSVCGGFLGGYAVFGRMAVFGSAQTANLIELVGDILGRNTTDALLRFGALVLYIAAMVIFSVMSKKTAWNLKYLVLLVDTAAVAVLSTMPEKMDPVLALYPLCLLDNFFDEQFETDCTFICRIFSDGQRTDRGEKEEPEEGKVFR